MLATGVAQAANVSADDRGPTRVLNADLRGVGRASRRAYQSEKVGETRLHD
jgi:hypothetical protein